MCCRSAVVCIDAVPLNSTVWPLPPSTQKSPLTGPPLPAKSKKQRRLAAKKKQQHEAKLLASGDVEALAPKIPLQQQSINLPDGQGEGEPGGVEGSVLAAQKREELRRAMRRERKVKIKEVNYLKTL